MGFENYISESEAAVVTGVGVSTLRRFAEAGYFKVETESDGLRLYCTSELEKVFGPSSHVTSSLVGESSPPPQQFKPWEPPASTLSPESNGHAPRAVTVEKLVVPQSLAAEPIATPKTAREPSAAHTTAHSITSSSEPKSVAPTASAAVQPIQAQPPIAAPAYDGRAEGLERDVQKLKTISEMHERLLCIREEEIRSLREEREWLRARVEKLEEKGSRDQLLLLSETQTIKALITIQEQRRSPVRLALEWLGFITPPSVDTQPPRSAIDVTLGSESPKR